MRLIVQTEAIETFRHFCGVIMRYFVPKRTFFFPLAFM